MAFQLLFGERSLTVVSSVCKRCVRDVVYVDDTVCKADRSGAAAKCCFHSRGVSSATLLAG